MAANAHEQDLSFDLEPSDSGLVGTVIGGRYRIVRELARGGLGEVYEARHVELERTVAVKVLSGEIARNAEAIKRFQREAQTASQIGHPNIVDVHDFGRTQDGLPYLAMEKLEGSDLDDLLAQEEKLPPERVVEILAPVASALDAVHARGIVHRDIKPANIYLAKRIDGSEQVKLLDFGLAAFHERGDRLTQMGNVVGTPHYMPPEAAEGELSGPQGDVYSLAVVAYECISGLLPFDAEQATGVLVKKVARPAPTMSARTGQKYPDEVEQVLHRALSREIARRPATAGEFVSALRDAIRASTWDDAAKPASIEIPVEDEEAPSDVIESGRFEPTQKRSSTPLVIGLAVVVLAAAGIGGYFGLSGGSDDPASSPSPTPIEHGSTAPVEPELALPAAEDPTPAEPVEAEPAEPAEAAAPAHTEEPAADPAPVEAPAAPARTSHRDRTRRGRNEQQAASAAPPEAAPAEPERDPARAADLARQAQSALLTGQLAQAASLFRQATQTDSTNVAAWRGLGLAQEQLGHAPEAARAYRQYLRLAPGARDAAMVRQHLERLQQ